MRKTISGYVHHAGRHCGSTSLSNVARFWGLGLSEAFCFGLGSGLGFRYLSMPGMSPSKALFPRNHSMEADFLKRSGAKWELKTTKEADTFEPLRREIDAGHPVIVNVDIFGLKYFQSKTHFNAHKIVVFGYDTDKNTAIISDSEFDGVEEEPLESFAAARASNAQPSMGAGSPWYELGYPEKRTDWRAPVREAVLAQASALLDPGKPDSLATVDLAVKDLPSWAAIPDLKWSSRFAYQIIEKRGTGGGAFRKMYGDFLTEAAAILPELKGLDRDMAAVGEQWTSLSSVFKTVSELDGEAAGQPGTVKTEIEKKLGEAARLLARIRESETRVFETARNRLK